MNDLKELYIEASKEIEMASIFQALANVKRLKILHMLEKPSEYFPQDYLEGNSVQAEGIRKAIGLSQSTVSEFMSILRNTGLVASRKKGKSVFYSRNPVEFKRLADRIRKEL